MKKTIFCCLALFLLLPILALAPPIGTPSMVVAIDGFTNQTTITSTSATPAAHAVIIAFTMVIDNGTPTFGTPTDNWANTAAWTEEREVNDGFAYMSGSWTTTGVTPGAGSVQVVMSEEAPSLAFAVVEVTGVQLRRPRVNDNEGTSSVSTLSITVSGTLQANDVMVSCVWSRSNTDGTTPTGNNIELDDATSRGGQDSGIQTQYNVTDLVASWSALDAVDNVGIAFHIRGLKNISVTDAKPQVRLLDFGIWKNGKRI